MGKRHVNQIITHINVIQCDKCEESEYLVQWEQCWKIWSHRGRLRLPKEVRMAPRFGDQGPEPQDQAEGRNRILGIWGLTSSSISTLRNFSFITWVIEAKDSKVYSILLSWEISSTFRAWTILDPQVFAGKQQQDCEDITNGLHT